MEGRDVSLGKKELDKRCRLAIVGDKINFNYGYVKLDFPGALED